VARAPPAISQSGARVRNGKRRRATQRKRVSLSLSLFLSHPRHPSALMSGRSRGKGKSSAVDIRKMARMQNSSAGEASNRPLTVDQPPRHRASTPSSHVGASRRGDRPITARRKTAGCSGAGRAGRAGGESRRGSEAWRILPLGCFQLRLRLRLCRLSPVPVVSLPAEADPRRCLITPRCRAPRCSPQRERRCTCRGAASPLRSGRRSLKSENNKIHLTSFLTVARGPSLPPRLFRVAAAARRPWGNDCAE